MNKVKVFRDSVHGYIEIDENICSLIIDTPLFQRLRRIEQTSMRVLYPAARHDRFIHSIGTYHISKLACNSLAKRVKDSIPSIDMPEIIYNFELAALLHDIGHSPFSHTLENNFAIERIKLDDNNIIKKIEHQLFENHKNCLSEDIHKDFLNDFFSASPSAHEIVSSIIVMMKFEDSINSLTHMNEHNTDMDFIVRAIMGVVYTNKTPINKTKNCFIRLLNSSSIDVDKLDFIMRDSKVSGYDNTIIDLNRLLNAITTYEYLNKDGEKEMVLAFEKSALSVIQDVILSRNSLYTWIYSHHKVKYEARLIEDALSKISDEFNLEDKNEYLKNTFNVENITENLLCDDDIWVELKKHRNNENINRIFDRTKHKKAVWKSFVEFLSLFPECDNNIKFGDFSTENLIAYIKSSSCPQFINYLNLFESNCELDFEVVPVFTKLSAINANDVLIVLNGILYSYDVLLRDLQPTNHIREYFYLYYNNDGIVDKEKLIKYIKDYPYFKLTP